MSEDNQVCKECKLEKPRNENFFKKRIYTRKDGSEVITYLKTCNDCYNANQNLKAKERRRKPRSAKCEDGYRVCKLCEAIKLLNEDNFSVYKIIDDKKYYLHKCKECEREYLHEYYLENQDDIKYRSKKYVEDNRDEVNAWFRGYYERNKPKKNAINKAWRDNNEEKCKGYVVKRKEKFPDADKIYRETHKDEINEKLRIRRQNPAIKLRVYVSNTVLRMLKESNGSKNGKSILDFLEYSIDDLRAHIESKFEWWMTWDNWGVYYTSEWDDKDPNTWVWQLDHKIPQSDLPYASMEDENFKICWSLYNLRPLNAKQNLLDGTKRIRHKKKQKGHL